LSEGSLEQALMATTTNSETKRPSM
jgi:hypothetical protein